MALLLVFLLYEEGIGKKDLALIEMGSTFMLKQVLLAQILLYFDMCLGVFATSCLMFCSSQDQTP